MEKQNFKFPLRMCLFIMSLFVLSFSASYSYFSVTPNYATDEEERTTVVTTDYLDVNFTTSQYINNTNLLLVKPESVVNDAEKTTFNIAKKNGSTYNIKYNIYLTDLVISDNMKTADFKWDLLQNGVSIYSGNFVGASTGDIFMLTAEPLLLSNETSASYELRVWLEETDSDQSSLFNGSFKAKVGIDVYTVSRSK